MSVCAWSGSTAWLPLKGGKKRPRISASGGRYGQGAHGADPQGLSLAVHQRHTPARLVMDPAHYDGTSMPRVMAPCQRMEQIGMELATAPVAHRSRSNTMGASRSMPPSMTAARPKLDIDDA